jgi:hypothetical protein
MEDNDYLVEAYAGPHDFLNHAYWYDNVGNAIEHSGVVKYVGEVLNFMNVAVATPIVAASVIEPYEYLINLKRNKR